MSAYPPGCSWGAHDDALDRAATAAREEDNAKDEAAGAVLVACGCDRGCYECRGTPVVPRKPLRWDDGGASEAAKMAQARLPW